MYKKLINYRLQIFITIGVVALTIGAWYYYTHKSEIAQNHTLRSVEAIPSMLMVSDKPLQLVEKTQFTDCAINGSLPDSACTPGAVFADATKDKICVEGYTKTVRSVSTAMRKKVYAEYNIPYPAPRGSYELDHLIPLELGGNNDIANLFPEAAKPVPGFYEKDVVENYLNQQVCAGNVALSVAQAQIAVDWLLIYNSLSSEQIAALKQQYKSWASNGR